MELRMVREKKYFSLKIRSDRMLSGGTFWTGTWMDRGRRSQTMEIITRAVGFEVGSRA